MFTMGRRLVSEMESSRARREQVDLDHVAWVLALAHGSSLTPCRRSNLNPTVPLLSSQQVAAHPSSHSSQDRP